MDQRTKLIITVMQVFWLLIYIIGVMFKVEMLTFAILPFSVTIILCLCYRESRPTLQDSVKQEVLKEAEHTSGHAKYNLVVESSADSVKAVQILNDVYDLGLKGAEKLIQSVPPWTIKRKISEAEAVVVKRHLESTGIGVSIEPYHS